MNKLKIIEEYQDDHNPMKRNFKKQGKMSFNPDLICSVRNVLNEIDEEMDFVLISLSDGYSFYAKSDEFKWLMLK